MGLYSETYHSKYALHRFSSRLVGVWPDPMAGLLTAAKLRGRKMKASALRRATAWPYDTVSILKGFVESE